MQIRKTLNDDPSHLTIDITEVFDIQATACNVTKRVCNKDSPTVFSKQTYDPLTPANIFRD